MRDEARVRGDSYNGWVNGGKGVTDIPHRKTKGRDLCLITSQPVLHLNFTSHPLISSQVISPHQSATPALDTVLLTPFSDVLAQNHSTVAGIQVRRDPSAYALPLTTVSVLMVKSACPTVVAAASLRKATGHGAMAHYLTGRNCMTRLGFG